MSQPLSPGRRALLALAALLLATAACRREGTTPRGPAREAAHPVLFVGLDGADWQLLDGYMAAEIMPNLAALARAGRTGTLTTLQPPLSPLVWTTMMTGVSPLAHGILDFTRFNPATGAREPITAGERRVPAVWNMASDAGKSVAVFGLWATWPAEPVRGLLVADRFLSFTLTQAAPPPGIVYPADRESWARAALAHAESAVDFAAVGAYIPDLTAAEYRVEIARPDPYAHPVSALRRILLETRAYDELARDWIARERPDLAIVYFQGTDTIGHVFAPYAPPRLPSIERPDFDRYSRVPERYFAAVDRLLGEYRQLAAKNGALLMLASDHGFRWQEGRPERLSSAAAATAGRWHREEGIYLLAGPGIPPSTAREKGSVDQVCATLLALLGLPPGQGLAGPPLPGTIAGAPAATGAAVDYRARWHPAPAPVPLDTPAPAGGEDLAKLRALGYVGGRETAGRPAPAASRDTRTPGSYNNEGLLLRQAGRTAEAAAAFEKALALDVGDGDPSAAWNLSDLLESEGREPDRADRLLLRALSGGLPEGAERVLGRAMTATRGGQAGRGLRLLDGAIAARPDEPRLRLARGRLRMEGKRCAEARDDFASAARLAPADPLAHASLGLARLCLGDAAGAAQALRRSLALDPDQPQVRAALAQLGG